MTLVKRGREIQRERKRRETVQKREREREHRMEIARDT